jgi:molybdopterin synthase catalytic subunit
VGYLNIGDTALVASVAAAHRAEAFAACEQLVDLIKRTVPIWKRQHLVDGTTEWVGL